MKLWKTGVLPRAELKTIGCCTKTETKGTN